MDNSEIVYKDGKKWRILHTTVETVLLVCSNDHEWTIDLEELQTSMSRAQYRNALCPECSLSWCKDSLINVSREIWIMIDPKPVFIPWNNK